MVISFVYLIFLMRNLLSVSAQCSHGFEFVPRKCAMYIHEFETFFRRDRGNSPLSELILLDERNLYTESISAWVQ